MVFDLDGTLVDTIPDIADVFNIVLEAEGYPGHSTADYREYVGWGIKRTLELALPEGVQGDDFNRMLEGVIDEYARRPARYSRIYPGIRELLKYIGGNGVPMIVFTNKAEPIAKALVDAVFSPGIFKAVLGKTDNFPSKPDPSALNLFLRGENIGTSSILFIGDTPIDLETAVNSGVYFAGASWGFKSADVLEKAGSKLNFPIPQDLHRWLMNSKDKK